MHDRVYQNFFFKCDPTTFSCIGSNRSVTKRPLDQASEMYEDRLCNQFSVCKASTG